MTELLDVVSRTSGDTVVVSVSGEVDYTGIASFAGALADGQSAAAVVVLDLRGVEFIDSTGIGVMLDAHRRAQAQGTRFRIVPGSAVERVIIAAGLDGRLAMEHPLTALDVRYRPAPSAVAAARRAFAEAFADLPGDLLENGKIVISELVTNAVRQAGRGAGDGGRGPPGARERRGPDRGEGRPVERRKRCLPARHARGGPGERRVPR